jgi:hypothetical protein
MGGGPLNPPVGDLQLHSPCFVKMLFKREESLVTRGKKLVV